SFQIPRFQNPVEAIHNRIAENFSQLFLEGLFVARNGEICGIGRYRDMARVWTDTLLALPPLSVMPPTPTISDVSETIPPLTLRPPLPPPPPTDCARTPERPVPWA